VVFARSDSANLPALSLTEFMTSPETTVNRLAMNRAVGGQTLAPAVPRIALAKSSKRTDRENVTICAVHHIAALRFV
jgi:hypothetical protein